jgi:hypothetical protein
MSLLLNLMRRCMEGEGEGGGGGGSAKNPPQPEVFSREYVHELREENKSWRQKHQESETAKADALKQVEASTQVATDKIKEANAAADQRVIRAELKAAALKAGMVDLDGLKLADLSKVKLNDQGEVEGADKLMEDLKKAKPYLFGAESTSNNGKPPKPGDQQPKLATAMSDDEYRAARSAAVRR